ncbi:AAA family ATPase [Flagellimonas sp.]|uniref:AAA family ATPase n=1 Tax=Flagellimonas sp. TaxID=2058762 RepID=UPI003BB146F6
MLLEFKLKNFRSIKDEMVFSLVAESSKSKPNNCFERSLANDESVKLLKTAAIFGPNASGKSSMLRGMFNLLQFIHKNKSKAGQDITWYDPYLFDVKSKKLPNEFDMTFIGPDDIKYQYRVSYNVHEVIDEELNYYPNGRITNIFKRPIDISGDRLIHKGKLGDSFGNKEITVFHNRLMLSKFGEEEPHEFLSNLYVYFKNFEVINAINIAGYGSLEQRLNKVILKNPSFKKRLDSLIRAADTKIKSIDVKEQQNDSHRAFGVHSTYDGAELMEEDENLPLQEESHGTYTLFCIGGKILEKLSSGGVLFVDELDTSLHPYLTKMIVMMIQSEKLNPKNTQLVFTTHDVTLLERELLRKDQIWFTQKNDFGHTDLFSMQDFEGVREDTPFDKWYLAGKFGALPNIKSVESFFDFE